MASIGNLLGFSLKRRKKTKKEKKESKESKHHDTKTAEKLVSATEFSLKRKSKARKKSKVIDSCRDKSKNKANDKAGHTCVDKSTMKQEVEDFDEPDNGDLPTQAVPSFMKGVSDFQKVAWFCFAQHIFLQGVDGLLTEFNDNLKPYMGLHISRVAFDENPTKNRYKDVICNDSTRVVIDDGKGSNYIHANYVRGNPLFNEFICTQGPMATTTTDFWRMVLFTKSNHIIMLCDVVESGKIKCEQYWPEKSGDRLTFNDITIECVWVKSNDSGMTKTMLKIFCGNVVHFVRHCQWKTWPDRSIPRGSKILLRLLGSVRESPKPVIVHCSAGVGRTGTLVAVEMCLQRLLSSGQLNLLNICKHLRDQRMHVLQVDLQYVFLALSLLEYAKARKFWDNNTYLLEEYVKFRIALDETLKKREEQAIAAIAEVNANAPMPSVAATHQPAETANLT